MNFLLTPSCFDLDVFVLRAIPWRQHNRRKNLCQRQTSARMAHRLPANDDNPDFGPSFKSGREAVSLEYPKASDHR